MAGLLGAAFLFCHAAGGHARNLYFLRVLVFLMGVRIL